MSVKTWCSTAHISSSQLPVKIFFNQEQGQDSDGARAGLLLRNSKLIETINEELIIKAQEILDIETEPHAEEADVNKQCEDNAGAVQMLALSLIFSSSERDT
ncbi:uncharacterized [Tachysurus ichikawai]